MRAAHELQYDYVLQSARLQVAGVVWDRYGLLLAWAELSPNFTADDALECVLQALAVGS